MERRREIEALQDADFELPAELRAAEFALGELFEKEIRRQAEHLDVTALHRAAETAEAAALRGYKIVRPTVSDLFADNITRLVEATAFNPIPEKIQGASALISLASKLGVHVNLERAQEAIYHLIRHGAPTSGELEQLCRLLVLAPVLLCLTPKSSMDEGSDSLLETTKL